MLPIFLLATTRTMHADTRDFANDQLLMSRLAAPSAERAATTYAIRCVARFDRDDIE